MGIGFRRSAHWTLSFDATQRSLAASAGDDHQFAILDIDPSEGTQIVRLWSEDSMFFSGPQQTTETREIIEQLVQLGAIVPVPPGACLPTGANMASESTLPPLRPWSVIGVGGEAEHVVQLLVSSASGCNRFVVSDDSRELVAVVRCGGGYDDLLDATEVVSHRPHLLVDASFHHTICVGPLVIPGVTACLSCLVGRLRGRWGETQVAAAPQVTKNSLLISGLVLQAVEQWLEGRSPLSGRCVRVDSSVWTTTPDVLLRTSGCARCTTVRDSHQYRNGVACQAAEH